MTDAVGFDPIDSPLFEPWQDPERGVQSQLLCGGSRAFQGRFDVRRRPFVESGDVLWLGRHRNGDGGVRPLIFDTSRDSVDELSATLRTPPAIDARTGNLYGIVGDELRRWTVAGDVETVTTLPDGVDPIGTPLSCAANGTSVAVDVAENDEYSVLSVATETGEASRWHSFPQRVRSRFSPTDPGLLLIERIDPGASQRLWLARDGVSYRPVHAGTGLAGNAWWNDDGTGWWVANEREGTVFVDVETGRATDVWRDAVATDATSDGQELVATRSDERGMYVSYYHRRSGSVVDTLASRSGSASLVPAPRFVAGDGFVCYTTTVRGRPELAVTPVSELRERVADRY